MTSDKTRDIWLIFAFLYFIVGIISILVEIIIYKGVISNIIFAVCITSGITCITNKNRNCSIKRSLLVNSIILIVLITIFIGTLPKYSYKDAQIIIQNDFKAQGKKIEFIDYEDKTFNFYEKPALLIPRGYVITFKQFEEEEIKYYFFNPVTGVHAEGKQEQIHYLHIL
jgi:hypothetical protein